MNLKPSHKAVRWPAGMYSDREQEMQLPSVPLIQRKTSNKRSQVVITYRR
jgi:hypothetical protein